MHAATLGNLARILHHYPHVACATRNPRSGKDTGPNQASVLTTIRFPRGNIMKNQQGFTLIELMIVVAIIAIMAAIALPAYQDYVARSQVSEAYSLASGAKTAVAERYADTGSFTGITNANAGLSAAGSITGKYVTSVTVAGNAITALMKSTASVSSKVQGGTLILTGTDEGGSIKWQCNTGSIDDKFLPSVCR